jgi:hypothetical protein
MADSNCPGAAFTKEHDNKHLWLFISPESPAVCYHCKAKGE